jgi:hypothetical protein
MSSEERCAQMDGTVGGQDGSSEIAGHSSLEDVGIVGGDKFSI